MTPTISDRAIRDRALDQVAARADVALDDDAVIARTPGGTSVGVWLWVAGYDDDTLRAAARARNESDADLMVDASAPLDKTIGGAWLPARLRIADVASDVEQRHDA